MNIRYKVYIVIAIVYVLFLLNSPYDIWPIGAIILGVPMILAEIGTYFSIKRRNK